MNKIQFIYKKNIVILCVVFSNFFYAQNQESLVFTTFDNIIGKQNLAIYNGAIHINNDRVVKNKHRYFESDNYSSGYIIYNNQQYFDLKLKYDIFEDRLILNTEENSNFLGINLIGENISYFSLNNKIFSNSDQFYNFSIAFKKGFYQEIKFSDQFVLYVKHFKYKREIINEKSILVDYDLKNEFIIQFKGLFYSVNTKKEISKLFLASKDKIYSYFREKKMVEKENKVLFMTDLMKVIYSQEINKI